MLCQLALQENRLQLGLHSEPFTCDNTKILSASLLLRNMKKRFVTPRPFIPLLNLVEKQ